MEAHSCAPTLTPYSTCTSHFEKKNNDEGWFVLCLTVHTDTEERREEVLSLKLLVHIFLSGPDSCQTFLYISKMSSQAGLYFNVQ